MYHTRPRYLTLGDLQTCSSSPILNVALQINVAQPPSSTSSGTTMPHTTLHTNKIVSPACVPSQVDERLIDG